MQIAHKLKELYKARENLDLKIETLEELLGDDEDTANAVDDILIPTKQSPLKAKEVILPPVRPRDELLAIEALTTEKSTKTFNHNGKKVVQDTEWIGERVEIEDGIVEYDSLAE